MFYHVGVEDADPSITQRESERKRASATQRVSEQERERERYIDRDCEPITLVLSLLTVRSSSVAISIVDLIS
jgi:hypothetical protein